MMEKFGFGEEVATLTISIFVLGYVVGPLLWGPLSESFGRKYPLAFSLTAYTLFSLGCALSQNTASIIILRFLAGVFAASGLVIPGAMLADIWDPKTRGTAFTIYALAPFAGPSIAPIVSGFISVTGTSWRWVYWVTTILAGVCVVLLMLTIPETYT